MDTLCVTGCDTPADGYYLCHVCTGELVRSLRSVPELLGELDVVAARQVKVNEPVRTASASAASMSEASPVNFAATEVTRDLHNVVSTWCRDLSERTGHPLEVTDTATCAAWLVHRSHLLRTHPAIDELADEVGDAITRAWGVVDRPPQRRYVGPCQACGADLYARPEGNRVSCSGCGSRYDTEDRREWLLDQVADRLATGPELARALPRLAGCSITPAMIRGYVHRGRLVPHGTDRSGKHQFRVGDVLDLVVGP